MLQPDIRWSNYPLPPPPLPPVASPAPPNLPTHDEICVTSPNLMVDTGTCRPLTTTKQFESNIPCNNNKDNTSTSCKPPEFEDCDHSDFAHGTAVNSALNQLDIKHYNDVCPPVCDTRNEIPSDAYESSKHICPPKGEPQERIYNVMNINRRQSPTTTRRPFTIPGLPQKYIHPKPKDCNVPPPFISPESPCIFNFLRLKADEDLNAYIEKLCQLTTLRAHSIPSGDCGRSASKNNNDQITLPKQICSSPTVEFVFKPESGRPCPQNDTCEPCVTPNKTFSPSDVCKHITRTKSPSQEDLRKIMIERKSTRKHVCKPHAHIRLTHKDRNSTKKTIEEYCKKITRKSSGSGQNCNKRNQPWILQFCKPMYQTNVSIDDLCCNFKNSKDFCSSPSKPEHAKPPFVPEEPKSRDPYKDGIKIQSLCKPSLQFSSQSPCPIKIKPVCPDPPKRCPSMNCSNPRYNPPPICKGDICQSTTLHQRDSCKPDLTNPPPRNYSSSATNKVNMTHCKPLKPYERSTKEIWRPPMNAQPQTGLNMKIQIDEAEKSKHRSPRDPCCPKEPNHNQIPYNPCCPTYHNGNYRRFKIIFFLLGFPLIIFQVS